MNFPPILFNNEKFPTLLNQNHSQISASIISFQNLCKKLLKYENKESNFEQSIISWIKSLNISQLLKYFSFKNKWLVDILHELVLISNSKPYLKFKYIPNQSSNDKEPQDTKSLINCINLLFFDKITPKFSDFFNIVDEGFVQLSRGRSEGEQRRQELVDNIRYVTLNSGIQNYKEEEKNNNIEYNNVVTLSYNYLKNIERLITTFQDISNKECFKYPIEIETEIYSSDNSNKKNYYNFKMPKWLNKEFTFPELLCAYFEQCIIINFMYYKMYKSEISFLYYEQFDELIDNNKKLIEFIKNSGETKFEIIRNLHPDEIKKTINENSKMKKLICDKFNKDNDIRSSYIGKYSYSKKHTMKTIINSCITTVEKIFIRGELEFILFLNFFKDSVIFTTDDFAIKIIADIVNNYWKSKAAEDLLHEIDNNNDNNNDISNKKKKKKKKKRRDKNENINKEEIEKENENSNNINNIDIKSEMIINNKDKKIINNEVDEKDSNINIKEEKNKKNKIENKSENENDNKINEEILTENKNEKENIFENDTINIKDNDSENINERTENDKIHKKKKEKEFFLYPTIKDYNKKKKNKQKNKKNFIENINNKEEDNIKDNNIKDNINENDNQNNNIPNIEDDKTDLSSEKASTCYTKEEEKIIQNEIINENIDNNIKEKYKKENSNKSEYEYTPISKQKNKFNMGIKLKKLLKDNSNLIIPKHYHPHDLNYKYQKYEINHISNSQNDEINIETDPNIKKNNFLIGSNLPHFTSFNFQSKKKRNYRNKNSNNNINNKNIFPFNNYVPKNILEFTKEIIDNTIKVNENKKILQQIREKYIKKIYENINIILRNSKVEFQCSFYGSSVSGLSIENSDIDIMVKLRKNNEEKEYINKIMNILVDNLKKSDLNYLRNITPIISASVPVIKLDCDLCNDPIFFNEINTLVKKYNINYNDISKLFFDITFFETENELDKIPSELMLDYIKECTLLYPEIFDIMYIMKRFLFNIKLNKSYHGGISSYSLFLMTLAFIKSYKNNYEIPIGSLFFEYLYFYSNFNFYNTVIQPNKDNNIFENINDNNLQKYNLNIIDPITGLNVAKSTFKIEQIQTAFRKGFDNIVSNLYDMDMNNLYDNNNQEDRKILESFFNIK